MQYAPTRIRQKRTRFHYPQLRVREKPARFHISTPGCTQNLPGFIPKPSSQDISGRMLLRPYTGAPKTRLVLGANPCRRIFGGVCNTPLHGHVQNLTGFIFPHPDTPKTHPVLGLNLRRGTFRGVCFCTPTRVHQKIVWFHISAHGCAKNAPDFTLPNRDTPKTHPVSYFHTRMHPKTHPISYFPIRIHQKPVRF